MWLKETIQLLFNKINTAITGPELSLFLLLFLWKWTILNVTMTFLGFCKVLWKFLTPCKNAGMFTLGLYKQKYNSVNRPKYSSWVNGLLSSNALGWLVFHLRNITHVLNLWVQIEQRHQHTLKPSQFLTLPLDRDPVHKTTTMPHWKQMDQIVLILYLDCALLLERISVRITKSGRISGKQMDTDVVFHFTGCLCLANSFSRRVG